jgi:hypothetical protein
VGAEFCIRTDRHDRANRVAFHNFSNLVWKPENPTAETETPEYKSEALPTEPTRSVATYGTLHEQCIITNY